MLAVVIPSRNVTNLQACTQAVHDYEPSVAPQSTFIVDDDEQSHIQQFCEHRHFTRIPGVKPFIFARNANLGLSAAFAAHDMAVLLNDDALLRTRRGFTSIVKQFYLNPQYGLITPCTNVVGNENQWPHGSEQLRREKRTLCFVCVVIPKTVWLSVGPLDERYCLDHGVEDGDYSYRVRLKGLRLGVYDPCYVDHGSLVSTGRGGGNGGFYKNRALFEEKWGFPYESQ